MDLISRSLLTISTERVTFLPSRRTIQLTSAVLSKIHTKTTYSSLYRPHNGSYIVIFSSHTQIYFLCHLLPGVSAFNHPYSCKATLSVYYNLNPIYCLKFLPRNSLILFVATKSRIQVLF